MPAVRALPLLLLAALIAAPAAADMSFEITHDSPENFRAAVILTNPDERPVDGWSLEFTLDRTVIQAFGAEVTQLAADRYRFTPADWTRAIPAKGQVRFTFIGKPGNLKDQPGDVKLELNHAEAQAATEPAREEPAPTAPAAPAVTTPTTSGVAHTTGFTVKSAWNTGYTAEMVVINQSGRPLRPWKLELSLDSEIEELWDGSLRRAGSGRYVVTPKEYNQEIPPGGFVTFGFKARPAFAGGPTATRLTGGE